MDKRLYRLGRRLQSCGMRRLLGTCAALFSFAAGATADASDGSSLLHYAAGGFSYQVSLRSYEGSGRPPTRQTNAPPQALSRTVNAPVNEDTTIQLAANNAEDDSVIFFLTSW